MQVPAIMSSLVQSVDETPPAPQLVPPVTHFMQALAPACPNPILRYILKHCENRYSFECTTVRTCLMQVCNCVLMGHVNVLHDLAATASSHGLGMPLSGHIRLCWACCALLGMMGMLG